MDDAPPGVLFLSFYLYHTCLNPTLHNTAQMALLDQKFGAAHELSTLLNLGLHVSRKELIQNIRTTSTGS